MLSCKGIPKDESRLPTIINTPPKKTEPLRYEVHQSLGVLSQGRCFFSVGLFSVGLFSIGLFSLR